MKSNSSSYSFFHFRGFFLGLFYWISSTDQFHRSLFNCRPNWKKSEIFTTRRKSRRMKSSGHWKPKSKVCLLCFSYQLSSFSNDNFSWIDRLSHSVEMNQFFVWGWKLMEISETKLRVTMAKALFRTNSPIKLRLGYLCRLSNSVMGLQTNRKPAN